MCQFIVYKDPDYPVFNDSWSAEYEFHSSIIKFNIITISQTVYTVLISGS